MRRIVLALIASLPILAAAQSPIVSTYKSHHGCCGRFPDWLVPHSGVDFSGEYGSDVIAPADGDVVTHIGANPATCGNTVALHHREFGFYTIYCHFKDVAVRPGDKVRRGELIGTLGDSGVAGDCRRVMACPIVHMELTKVPRGHPRAVEGETFDVLQHSAGCFETDKSYPTDRLVLTYPVKCKGK